MTPDDYTNQELMLDVGDGHTLYVHDWGNKNAKTTFIVLHGGPGSQAKDKHKAPFDPKTHRVILFDQRGCGRSTPTGSLENNTTDKMVEDVTAIADKLGLHTFALSGSSWGSTLALAYAIAHPERVSALIIGGIFTGSQSEGDWIDKGGFATFYPDVWQAYLERTPKDHRNDPSAYHFVKVINGTPEEQKLSAYAYECMEGGVMSLDDRSKGENFTDYDPTGMRIEMYYLANGCFMPDRYILDNVSKLTMPVYLVQGRYDMVCPPTTAYELHQALPDSHLYWILSNHAPNHETENVFRSILSSV